MSSTGITLLDLALSDKVGQGVAPGRIYNIVGDSSTGKSLLALTILAEHFYFGGYDVIYNDVEAAVGFDLSHLFGKKFADKLELVENTDTIQDFYQDILIRIDKAKNKFIYVLDSLDALSSLEDAEIGEELKKSGKMKGTYGAQKARLMSQILRHINLKLKETESVLIVISQTRDNLDAFSFEKKTRAGGRALEFYSTWILWLAKAKSLTKKGVKIGVVTKAKITKNKLTGKLRDVQFPIYYDFGIDDISSMVDFLITEQVIKQTKLSLQCEELGIKGTRKKFIQEIENGKLADLVFLVEKTWNEREKSLESGRKSKYMRE